MPLVSKTVEVEASAETIMAIVADFESYPEWNEEIKGCWVLARYDDGRPSQLRLDVVVQGQSGTFITAVYYPNPNEIYTVLQQGDHFEKQEQKFSVVPIGPTALLTVDLEVETKLAIPKAMVKKAIGDTLDYLAGNLKDPRRAAGRRRIASSEERVPERVVAGTSRLQRCLAAQSHHPGVDPVLGGARHRHWPVACRAPAGEPCPWPISHRNASETVFDGCAGDAETLVLERHRSGRGRRGAVLEQIEGEHIAQLKPSQNAFVIHDRQCARGDRHNDVAVASVGRGPGARLAAIIALLPMCLLL